MNEQVKVALQVLLDNAIDLAEMSESPVHVTFKSVAIVVESGKSADAYMGRFERNETFEMIFAQLYDMITSKYSVTQFRTILLWMSGCENIELDLISGAATGHEHFQVMLRVVFEREIILTHEFWNALKDGRSDRFREEILPVKHRIEQEFGPLR